jgi:hypothetical protein
VPDWKIGDTFLTGDGRRLRIVDIVPEVADASVYVTRWMVEAVEPVLAPPRSLGTRGRSR